MILLGSSALLFSAAHVLKRKPSDFDFLCCKEDLDDWACDHHSELSKIDDRKYIANYNGNVLEFEVVIPGESSDLLQKLVIADENSITTPFGLCPSLDLLFAIKTSHRFRKDSPHFWKTLSDWHSMKNAGAVIKPEHLEFVKMRASEVSKATPKLNVDKKTFFNDDDVPYIYDHDSIHISVAGNQKPAYASYIKEGQEVLCSKEKWDQCDFDLKVRGVVEESAVLAIERSLVPYPTSNPKNAWLFAFSKVCTSITSGWFRVFAYENAPYIISKYPDGYWELFCEDVKNNKVKKF